jgi:hypothetical protein
VISTAIEGALRNQVEVQCLQTDAVKSLIFWASPHPLSIAGVKRSKSVGSRSFFRLPSSMEYDSLRMCRRHRPSPI